MEEGIGVAGLAVGQNSQDVVSMETRSSRRNKGGSTDPVGESMENKLNNIITVEEKADGLKV